MAPRARAARLLAAAFLAVLTFPVAPAHASFGFESTEFSIFSAPPVGAEPGAVGPPQQQAGSHPYLVRFAFTFNQTTNSKGELVPDEAAKDLEVDLPAGLIGNPVDIPQCLTEEFQSSSLFSQGCPQASQIGTMRLNFGLGELTLPIFNLEPPPESTAQFGVFAVVSPMVMNASVRSDGDYGLTVTLHNMPQFLPVVGGVLDLWGVPADAGHDTLRGDCLGLGGESLGECPAGVSRRPFLALPVSCGGPLAAKFRMDSWQNPGQFVSRTASPLDGEGLELTLEGCDALDLSPQISVRPESEMVDAPSGVEVDLRFPQNENPDGYAEAQPRNAVLELPPGLSLNPAAGDGLGSCSPEQIALGTSAEPNCPDSARIGSVTVDSPLVVEPLRGSIYLAAPRQNPFESVLATYVVAEGSGTLIKIPARIDADAQTGGLTVRLDELPQLPFSDFSLRFDGGPRAPLALPARCGDFTASARLGSYSDPAGAEPTTVSSSFPLTRDCDGGFSPSFLGGATSSVAGHRTGLTLRLVRGQGEEELSRFSTTLPRGLLPLLAGVSSCPEPQAGNGDCPPASRIGAVTVTAGAGPHPLSFSGSAFLTDSYKGAPFGLAIAVPAVAGPFDLGRAVIRAKVLVDPRSTRLTVATEPLPRILQGIPLRVRSFELNTTERPGLFTAPSSCERQEVDAQAVGGAGAITSLATPFFLGDCRELRFAPRISATTEKHVSRRTGASLRLTIRNRLGAQANLRTITLGFPRQLSPRLSSIQGACPAATFAAGPDRCPATATIGVARVHTPIFESALSGSAYLVSRGAEALPRIVLVLAARGVALKLLGSLHVSNRGKSSVTFAAIPDAPISKFVIDLPKGPNSAFGANFLRGAGGTLCGRRIVIPTKLIAYNGRRAQDTARVGVTGCKKSAP
jgi:hypothetical protein